MTRKSNHSNQVTAFLDKRGILSNGSESDIAEAKKLYWRQYRKEWRKRQRKECKRCTIFLTAAEHKVITQALIGKSRNVTGFIKRTALNAAQNKMNIEKELIGKIRAQFFSGYAEIEKLLPSKEIIQAFMNIERTILNLVH